MRGIEATLGVEIFVSERAEGEIVVRGALERVSEVSASGFRAHVIVDGGRVERQRTISVRGDDCSRLDDSMVVVLAMLLDEVMTVNDESPRSSQLQVSEEPLRPPSEDEHIDLTMRLGARFRYDVLPGATFGPDLESEVGYGIFAVFAGLSIWPDVTATLDGGGGRFSGWSAELGLCLRATALEWLQLGGCISGEIGDVHAIGIELDRTVAAKQLHVAVGARVFGRAIVTETIAFYGAFGVVTPILRPHYRFFDGAEERNLFRATPLAPDILLGIELRTS